MRIRHFATVTLAAGAALAAAGPSAAQTVLLADDMEAAIDKLWKVDEPTNPLMEPWQPSDSAAPKVRGNQANGGRLSYWAGMKPEGMHPVDVVSGSITLMSKQPIIVPADGKTSVSFFSLFQNEGDDSGTFEAAVATANLSAKGTWKKVAAVKLEPSTADNPDPPPGYCVANPNTAIYSFEEIKGDFTAFAGAAVLVRFNLTYGSENRASSMPCGWYVDDLKVTTTGTPGKLAAPPTTAPPTTTPAPVAPAVKFASKLAAKGKKATLGVTVRNASITNATITLLKGSKKVAVAKVAKLDPGARKVTFKLKKKLAKGAYKIKLTGTGGNGTRFSASGKTKF